MKIRAFGKAVSLYNAVSHYFSASGEVWQFASPQGPSKVLINVCSGPQGDVESSLHPLPQHSEDNSDAQGTLISEASAVEFGTHDRGHWLSDTFRSGKAAASAWAVVRRHRLNARIQEPTRGSLAEGGRWNGFVIRHRQKASEGAGGQLERK